MQTAETSGRIVVFTLSIPPPFAWLPVTNAACQVPLLRGKANVPCAWPWPREECAEGIIQLLVYQSLGTELEIRVSLICLLASSSV